MITNFQLKPRNCKYHNLPEQFICMHKDCQYRALLCSECTRQSHNMHLHEIRSIDSFIESFKQKVKFYETQFQKQKVVINVKEIIRTKINQLDQVMNELLISIVKMLEKEKELIKDKLTQLEEKYETLQADYKKNLEARFDCLEYLSAYKNSPQVLQARLICSSEWGIVSLKNALTEIKNLSINQARDVNQITDTIIHESQKILREENFIFGLKQFIRDHNIRTINMCKKSRLNSFIEKSFISTNANPTIIMTPKTSRVIEQQRPRTFSLSNLNVLRPVSNHYIPMPPKQTSMERIPLKIASEASLDNIKYVKGLRKLKLENVIIK